MRVPKELKGVDRRLTQIIQDLSLRMNRIIENVLHLQRRERMSSLRLELKSLEILENEALVRHIKGLGLYLSGQPGESILSRLDFKARQESGCFCMTFALGRNPR
ncbi:MULTISPECIES: hypothetical protein [unclassified Pseudomonas]|uniref:hypothetical protein n=1 Tax=unclassified Pseudomonas TaxID=196821 RepID=UPI0021151B9C|nr:MULTISPECIES: hypothetical protein [unclassified Pseudomonas]